MIASYTLLSEKPVQFGIAINRFADNSSVTTLSLSFPANSLGPHVWTPDGKAIAQLVTVDGVSNIWICPLDGNAPAQLTKFKSGHIFTFDWSRDGKQLAIARGNQSQDVVLLRDFR
jgi:Tol biopolymer transport system component